MLSEVKIKAFGIIEQLTWRLYNGLNVITGETGAGKSLIVEALEALLEGRLDKEKIRYGADESRIEAVFFLENSEVTAKLKVLLENKGIELEEETLVISCDFRRQGRTVIRINGSAVSRSVLRETGSILVDIHGQSQHLSLFDSKNHLEYLDSYAGLQELRASFSRQMQELYGIERKQEELVKAEQESDQRREILEYQVDEIKRAALKDEEDSELERRRDVLASYEKLKTLAFESYEALNGEDSPAPSALVSLNNALRALRRLSAIDPLMLPQAEALEVAITDVQETAREVSSYKDRLDYNPAEIEEIENRLGLVRSLKRKYGGSIGQVKDYLAQAEKELQSISTMAQDRLDIERQHLEIKEQMGVMAGKLSAMRLAAAGNLAAAVQKELDEIDMSQVKFEVCLCRNEDDTGLPLPDGKVYGFTRDGVDEVEFMVSTNPGEPLKPLAVIASTGEVSRFTLALKVALAEADRTPLLVFDEIDIGIGGRSGDTIGKKLWSLARHHQVVCVTHLPQIAAFADMHFNVYKEVDGERTLSLMNALDAEMRLKEVALMLAGPQGGAISLKNAGDIIGKAQEWIKDQNGNTRASGG